MTQPDTTRRVFLSANAPGMFTGPLPTQLGDLVNLLGLSFLATASVTKRVGKEQGGALCLHDVAARDARPSAVGFKPAYMCGTGTRELWPFFTRCMGQGQEPRD